MIFTLFRAANAVFAVVVAILVSQRYGDNTTGKILTVVITASVVAFFEWLLSWAPKHSVKARNQLDPRARFSGVWIQQVKFVHSGSEENPDSPNNFAVFTVAYSKDADNYAIEGIAYTKEGEEHANWYSEKVVHFAKDGRSMTYMWKGTVTNPKIKGEPGRTGFCNLNLIAADGGTGRVDHVAVEVILEFNFSRITREWLAENQVREFEPEKLANPVYRKRFALALAKARASSEDEAAK